MGVEYVEMLMHFDTVRLEVWFSYSETGSLV